MAGSEFYFQVIKDSGEGGFSWELMKPGGELFLRSYGSFADAVGCRGDIGVFQRQHDLDLHIVNQYVLDKSEGS